MFIAQIGEQFVEHDNVRRHSFTKSRSFGESDEAVHRYVRRESFYRSQTIIKTVLWVAESKARFAGNDGPFVHGVAAKNVAIDLFEID